MYQSMLHANSFITHQEVTIVDRMKRLPELPAERALKVIAGRWKAVILYHLFGGAKRLSELKRLAPNASQKVLIQQLREMEQHGLVSREIFRQVPPRVDYTATALGLSLEPVIMSLCEWGRRHATELNELSTLSECVIGRPAQRIARSPPVAPASSPPARMEPRKVSAPQRSRARLS
jgi:DNA-binding HxlR family transcriptional regulator